MNSKVCKICKNEKLLVEFHKQKGTKDGHRSQCKACRKQDSGKTLGRPKQYRQDNAEKHNLQCKFGKGMTRENAEYIGEYHHVLEKDMVNGKILNRNASALVNGYPVVGLGNQLVYHHQVFAIARWGIEACVGMTVNHINEIKTDNRAVNLELLSLADNNRVKTKQYNQQSIKAIKIDTGEEITFESIGKAAKLIKTSSSNICKVLNGVHKQAKGYRFERVAQ